ncbi:MAG: hypothetical protein U1F43_25665 [Myxococcota bacterium]
MPQRFSVATFGRVFDMTPQGDALTLDELAAALTRFQLKAQLAGRIRKELERFQRGEGPYAGVTAAKVTAGDIEHRIRREAKTDLRIWTPALFAPGARRETSGLLHVSGLVYDIDQHLTLEAAREALRPWWHVGHSTWSHSPEAPKFRVCIPFAQPIVPEDFLTVWDWGNDAIGGVADRTGRFLARGMALPAVPSREAPRAAWVHVAPLFDPVKEGIAQASPHASPEPTGLSFMRADPTEIYLTAEEIPDEGDDDPWSGGAPIPSARAVPVTPVARPSTVTMAAVAPPAAAAPAARPSPAPAPDLGAILARLDALEQRLAALEKKAP